MDKVYVVMYHDPGDGYIGVDVFRDYKDAVKQFKMSLAASKHEEEKIAELFEDTETMRFPYYRTTSGYEVIVTLEYIQ